MPFGHQEIEVLENLANLENLEDQITKKFDKGQNSQNDEVQENHLTIDFQTSTKLDNVNKKALS